MNLITVIPIARSISKEHLTYFSSEEPPLGSVIEAPLRSKKMLGLVVKVEKVESKKSEIKTLPYGMKKLTSVQAKSFLLPEFIEASKILADYYATATGAVLSSLLPKAILESVGLLVEKDITDEEKKKRTHGFEIVALQASDDERYSTYRSLIREEFAKKNSVCVILPSIEDIRVAEKKLNKGIEAYTFVLHNNLPKKEIVEKWKEALDIDHQVLIIATGSYLCLPRKDMKVVVIESESSRGYTQIQRPFLDIRTVAEVVSRTLGARLVVGDTALRAETIYRVRENEISELGALKFRALTSAECVLVDTRTPKNQAKKEFEIVSRELEQLIQKSKETNDHLFLFCARKGLAPLTACADCGQTVSCTHCGSPVVLYGKLSLKGADNFFLCPKCGEKMSTSVLCTRCGSWKLTPLGVGIEGVEKEIIKKFPEVTVYVMDKDHIKTHKQAEALMKKFYDNPGSILLATEMALPYVKETIGFTGVVSLDAFFAVPDWKIQEKIMNILLTLRTIASKRFLLQTRRPDERVFDYALKGNLADFYRDEIEERKRFGYPPFNTFIKITLQGKKMDVREKMERLKEEFKPYDVNIFEAFHPGSGTSYILHGLILLKRGKWPETALLEKLRMLSPSFMVKIDPDSLL